MPPVSSPTGRIHWGGREKPYVPVSLKCTAYEYLIPARAYIQSTIFPGARYNIEQSDPTWNEVP